MKLSLKLIALGLPKGNVQIVASRKARPDQRRLTSLMLWNRNETWDYAVCYCIDAVQIREDFHCPDDIALIVLGNADPRWFSGVSADVMIWDADQGFQEQFNQISSIFWYYQVIEDRLYHRLMDNCTVQELISFGETMFRNPVLLLDSGFSLLFKSRKRLSLDWDLSGAGHIPTLPADTVEQIRLSSEFRNRESKEGVFSVSGEVLNCHGLFIQIQREQLVFYCGILETEHPLAEAHEQLLQFFSESLFFALRSRRFSSARSMYFEDLIDKMLLNEKIEQTRINRQLQSLHWKINDRYLCFVLELDLWQRKDIDSYSICRMVEHKFPDTYAFFHEDRIICITNLEQSGLMQDTFLQLLAPYVRDQLFRAGVSFEFWDFSALANYHAQALAALELGKQNAPDEWSHRFEKYALAYFTRYGTSRMEAQYLCHPDLIRLNRYDRANNTNLLHTLRVYLTCGQNATTAAAELYIHRNTLYQRMSKIESLIHSTLSDPVTRLYLQISFSIADFPSMSAD